MTSLKQSKTVLTRGSKSSYDLPTEVFLIEEAIFVGNVLQAFDDLFFSSKSQIAAIKNKIKQLKSLTFESRVGQLTVPFPDDLKKHIFEEIIPIGSTSKFYKMFLQTISLQGRQFRHFLFITVQGVSLKKLMMEDTTDRDQYNMWIQGRDGDYAGINSVLTGAYSQFIVSDKAERERLITQFEETKDRAGKYPIALSTSGHSTVGVVEDLWHWSDDNPEQKQSFFES